MKRSDGTLAKNLKACIGVNNYQRCCDSTSLTISLISKEFNLLLLNLPKFKVCHFGQN